MEQRAAILHDAQAEHGRADASDVLAEAAHMGRALHGFGYAVSTLPATLDLGALERTLRELQPRVIVNLVESLEGRGQLIGVVPALLESLGLPFTGCSAIAQSVTSHKLLAKAALQRAGLRTPPAFAGNASLEHDLWIVKSLWEHASLGLDDTSLVRAAGVPAAIADRTARYGGQWFAEGFIPGRELNVAVIAAADGPRVLPPAEIRFVDFPPEKPRIVGYAAKWDENSFEGRNTVREFGVEAPLAAAAAAIARECWTLFALDGYARVDLRVDERGTPWVLEVNSNPCFSPDAGFAAALQHAGIDYGTGVRWLVEDALRRCA